MAKSTWRIAWMTLVGSSALAAMVAAQPTAPSSAPASPPPPAGPPFDKVVKVVDGVWFAKHNHVPSYGSNVAWIAFADFVVVVDTAFPLGAERALRSIKETTGNKPIRYAI